MEINKISELILENTLKKELTLKITTYNALKKMVFEMEHSNNPSKTSFLEGANKELDEMEKTIKELEEKLSKLKRTS